MSNRPSRGLTNANSIVIVCEGTDTEYNYFDELCRKDVVKQRFDEIKVVPHPAEMIKQHNPKRPRKGCMLPDGAKFHYHIK